MFVAKEPENTRKEVRMLEYTISGEVYSFNAGFNFIREAQALRKNESGEPVGLVWCMAGIEDRNPERLRDALLAMNVGLTPRVTQEKLEGWIEDHTDIDTVYDEVADFFGHANCTKEAWKRFQSLVQLARPKKK